ncbi:MAG: ATP-binding protein [Candidatus Competibacterales bacterium]
MVQQLLDQGGDRSQWQQQLAPLGRKPDIESERNIELALQPVPLLPLHAVAIQRRLTNLIDNAPHHAAPPLQLATGQGSDGKVVWLAVRDRGPGLSEAKQQSVLRPFATVDPARGRGSHGLGLTIVERVARSHGGSVQLANRDGGGLEVRVELPLPDKSS